MLQKWSKLMTKLLRTFIRRGALFVLAGLMAVTLTFTPLMTRTANAQFDISSLLSLGGSLTNGLSSCAIETVGWVICPTMRSIAKLADYGFNYINQSFMKLDYSFTANDSGTYKAWEVMRNIANAAFVIAIMSLVYTQLTGRGTGSYSIKRLIPRLIIAAITVNVSYYICVALIDISNILGDSILNILQGIATQVGTSVMPINQQGNAFQDGTLTTITTSVMSKTGVAWVLLAPVAAVIVSVAVVCAAALVLLIARKTIVAMLILASPLLFVAYLLPNLERFFTQGSRLFIQLLLIYPIFALLLGAGQIVSATIVSVGSNDTNYRASNDSYFARNGGSGSAITDLTAAGAAVLPLLGAWFLFKNMTSLMTTAGSRISASVRSRRGGEEDKEARVTGKATIGARNLKTGGPTATGNRRQAYSRNRRRRSLGGSSLLGNAMPREGARPGESGAPNAPTAQPPQPNPPSLPNQPDLSAKLGLPADLGLLNEQGIPGNEAAENEKSAQELQQSQVENQIQQDIQGGAQKTNIDTGSVAEALGKTTMQTQQKQQQKRITAKDIFSSLNKGRDRVSKDQDRRFGAGAPPAGSAVVSGGGSANGGGGGQTLGPTVSYRAPEIAQNANIVSGASLPQQPIQVVAVPVQIDASSLLGPDVTPNQGAIVAPGMSSTAEKAKERVNKYLYNADHDLQDARDRQDLLGHTDNPVLVEPPHTDSVEENTNDKTGENPDSEAKPDGR